MKSPDAGSSGGYGNDVTITHAYDTTIKSSASNGDRGCAQGGHIGRGGHQVRSG